METVEQRNYAILIDAENISSDYAEKIIEEIIKYGTPTIKRIYGNWSDTKLKKWEQKTLDLALTPRQQFTYTKGKNANDMLLVIDAMDILYMTNRVDGICIVSSDSDFIPLVNRLKESNLHLIGMGEVKTPKPFYNACDKFIYLENLIDDRKSISDKGSGTTKKVDKVTIALIKKIIRENCDDSGRFNNAQLTPMLEKYQPEFDPRTFGYTKLTDMLRLDENLKKIFEFKKEHSTLFISLR